MYSGPCWSLEHVNSILRQHPPCCSGRYLSCLEDGESIVYIGKFPAHLPYRHWPRPVTLRNMTQRSPIAMTLNLKEWNPTLYPVDRTHIMPIITPAYPVMCSTHNVSDSTLAVMMQEFVRGKNIHQKIMEGKATWDELFEESDFFTKYKWYLEVTTSTGSEETMHLWFVPFDRFAFTPCSWRFIPQGRHSRVKASNAGQRLERQHAADQDRTSVHRRQIQGNCLPRRR